MNRIMKITGSVFLMLSLVSASVMAYVPSIDDVPYDEALSGGNSTKVSISEAKLDAAYDLLSYIGIIDEDKETVDTSISATKSLAAKYFSKIKSDTTQIVELPYTDVSEQTEYYEDICSAYSLDIITDAPKFNPTSMISPEDIAKMAMRAVDYERFYGDDKAMSFADKYDIFKNVDISKGYLTLGELIRTVENTLTVPYIEYTLNADGSYSAEIKDISYLYQNKHIDVQNGIITAIGYSSIYGDSELSDYEIEINRGKFNCNTEIDKDLLGKSIRAYIYDDKSDIEIISVWEYRNNVQTLKYSEFEKAENNVLYTAESNKYKVTAAAKVLYNGIYFGTNEKAVNELKYDKFDYITIIDNDDDNVYDVIKIYKSDTYIVKSISGYSERIDLKYNYDSIEIRDNIVNIHKNGSDIIYTGLSSNDVLSVYYAQKSDGTKVYEIYASAETVTDILKSKYTDLQGISYYILNDSNYYELSDNFIYFLENDTTETKPSIGTESTFLLSYDGKIAGVASKNSGFNYGWLMRSILYEDEELYGIQAVMPDGSVERYNFKENVKFFDKEFIDGKKMKADVVYKRLGIGDELFYGMIGFKINANNEISELVMPIDCTGSNPGMTDYPLTKDYTNYTGKDSSGKPMYRNVRCYNNVLDAKYSVGGVTTIVYPVNISDRRDEKKYSRSTFSYQDEYFPTEELTLYNTNKFFTPSIITLGMNISQKVEDDSTPYMIKEVYMTINEDDMPVTAITYSSGSSEVTKRLSDDCIISEDDYKWYGRPSSPSELKPGDIIQYNTDIVGDINCIRVIYKSDNPSPIGFQDPRSATNPSITMSAVSAIKVIHGKVVDYDNKCILVNIADEGADDIWPIVSGYSAYGKVTYVMFNKKNHTVTEIDRSEIQTGDEIVIRKQYNHGVNFYIIR